MLLSEFVGSGQLFNLAIDRVSLGKASPYIAMALASYVVGHFISYISSLTIEKYGVWLYGRPSHYVLGDCAKGYFCVEGWREVFARCFVAFLVAPVVLMDHTIGWLFYMRDQFLRPLGTVTQKIIWARVNTILSQYSDQERVIFSGDCRSNEDIFRTVYHHAIEHTVAHRPRMQNYLALYGFCRAVSLVWVMWFWMILSYLLWCFASGGPCKLGVISGVIVMLSTGVAAYLMFCAFMKFYRRFAVEAFLAAVVSTKEQSASS